MAPDPAAEASEPHFDDASARAEPAEQPLIRLRLYLTPPTPTSVRAMANLLLVLEALGESARHVAVETIDVTIDPLKAFDDRVIVTPSLILRGTAEAQSVIGDLSDIAMVRNFITAALHKAMANQGSRPPDGIEPPDVR
jgi:hypothetical protein